MEVFRFPSIVPEQAQSKTGTKMNIYSYIIDNLKHILPIQIRDDKTLLETFIDIFMNEVQITEEHRQMFKDKVKTSLEELVFAYRIALMLELDRHSDKFNQIYYQEIYDRIFRNTNYKLAFVSNNKIMDMDHEISYRYKKSVEDEIEYLVNEFKKYVSNHPGVNRMSIRISKNGMQYREHAKIFVDDIVNTKISRFTFELKTVKDKDGVNNLFVVVIRN